MREKDLRYRDGKLGEKMLVTVAVGWSLDALHIQIIPTIGEKSPTPDLLGLSQNGYGKKN